MWILSQFSCQKRHKPRKKTKQSNMCLCFFSRFCVFNPLALRGSGPLSQAICPADVSWISKCITSRVARLLLPPPLHTLRGSLSRKEAGQFPWPLAHPLPLPPHFMATVEGVGQTREGQTGRIEVTLGGEWNEKWSTAKSERTREG